jgi:hypothetical protein
VVPKLAVRAAARVTGVCTRERTIGARTKLAGRTARVAMRKMDRDDMSGAEVLDRVNGRVVEKRVDWRRGKGGGRRESCWLRLDFAGGVVLAA